MRKAKSRKSVSRRFKITGTGKVLHRIGFGRHLRRKKSKRQLRHYKKLSAVTGHKARRIKRLMAKA